MVRQLPVAPEKTPIVSRRALGFGTAGIVGAALAGGVAAVALRTPPVEPEARFVIDLPDSVAIGNSPYRQVALSRDGSRAVFHFANTFPGPLYTRRTGEMQFDVIPGTDSARSMVISPNGRHVLYWIQSGPAKLMKVPIEGGAPVKIADSATGVTQASWGDGDRVIFRRGSYLVLVSADGGPEHIAARPDTSLNQFALGWPEMLPGGKAALITIQHDRANLPDSLYLGAVFLEDGRVVDFGIRGLTPHYASGHLLYVRQDGQLFARPFDAGKVRFTGEPRAVAKGVAARATGGRGAAYARGVTDLAVSETGTILFTDGGSDLGSFGSRRRSIVVQSAVQATWIKAPQLAYRDLRASPDGARLALTIEDSTNAARSDVHILTFATGQLSRFTRDGMSSQPVWRPDGKRIIYRVTDPRSKPVLRFYSRPWDESEAAVPVAGADGAEAVEFAGPFGKYIAYVRGDSDDVTRERTNSDILIAPVDSPAAARPFAATGLRERMPRFSPNGRWLAYIGHELPSTSDASPQAPIVYVRPVPGPGAVKQISLARGNTPLWSRDGRTLSYFSEGGAAPLVAARVSEERGFDVASRHEVFRRAPPGTGIASPVTSTSADILPNGDVVYLTVQPPPAFATPSGALAPVFSSNVIAIVNWLGAGRNAPSR